MVGRFRRDGTRPPRQFALTLLLQLLVMHASVHRVLGGHRILGRPGAPAATPEQQRFGSAENGLVLLVDGYLRDTLPEGSSLLVAAVVVLLELRFYERVGRLAHRYRVGLLMW